ncbi:MAG: GNAT family N-acetyltransferase [Alphaproteobacteria bacterium]
MEDPALTTLRAVRPGEVGDLAALLTRAFAADSVLDWFLRPWSRRRAAELFFARVVADALPFGGVRVDAGFSACAVWLPPGAEPAAGGVWAGLGNTLWMLRVASPLRLSRLEAVMRTSAEIHPKEKCYYLSFIGTLPEARGGGLASDLIGETLSQADADGVPAFLETADAAKVGYYQRFGFELTGQAQLPLGGPALNLMWREPHSSRLL